MGIFENFDQTTWILFGLLVAALLGYYFWPEQTEAESEVHRDEETRKKAKSLIALASDSADQELFQLIPMPLRIKAGAKLQSAAASGGQEAQIAEALWVQQRAMITRLEGELDYAQQADVSDHFAIAAPANTPGALLEKTLKDLEGMYTQIRQHLKLEADRRLWNGRALVVMMSTRKLFDHVAWLTGAGHAASAPGSFTIADDGIVMITIYATRLGGFARPLTLQVSRAAIRCTGGPATPLWLEYGLAHWLADKMLGKAPAVQGEEPPKWTEESKAVLDEAAWQKANDDSAKLEKFVVASSLLVANIMAKEPARLITDLKSLPQNTGKPSEWAASHFPVAS